MNQQDTAEAIKEAKLIHQSTFSEAQILLSLELFYMLGQKAEQVAERDRLRAKLKSAKDLRIKVTGE